MRSPLRTLPALLLMTCIAVTSLAAAESKAVQTMAGILANLNHFASDSEKATLKGIVEDKATPAPEKTIAQALINVQHTVSAADKPKLQALVSDKDTPASIKTLAEVILALNHTPSDAEKAKLKKLMS
jgi:hypothetical protein